MAHYILIDNASGYIFGDSRDLDGKLFVGTPAEFAAALDESIGEHGHGYVHLPFSLRSHTTGYHVYRIDVRDSEAVAIVQDGQNPDTIQEVVESCEYAGFVYRTARED